MILSLTNYQLENDADSVIDTVLNRTGQRHSPLTFYKRLNDIKMCILLPFFFFKQKLA